MVGDQMFAVFDGLPPYPLRVLEPRCRAETGIAVRVGIHTGEVEYDDRTIGGITLHTGSRIKGVAARRSPRVPYRPRAGCGGWHRLHGSRDALLKGLPGEWMLFRPDVPEGSATTHNAPRKLEDDAGDRGISQVSLEV